MDNDNAAALGFLFALLMPQWQTSKMSFTYKNHREETLTRTVSPHKVWYGSTQWHKDPQYFLEAFDHDKMETRSFALRDIAYETIYVEPQNG